MCDKGIFETLDHAEKSVRSKVSSARNLGKCKYRPVTSVLQQLSATSEQIQDGKVIDTTRIDRQLEAQGKQQILEYLQHDLRKRANKKDKSQIINIRSNERRIQYLQRREKLASKCKSLEYIPKNISPFLNPLYRPDLSEEKRLYFYSLKHKCKHKRKFSSLIPHYRIYNDGTKRLMYYQPQCHCTTEKILDEFTDLSCKLCPNKKLKKVEDNTTIYYIFYCVQCKTKSYYLHYDFKYPKYIRYSSCDVLKPIKLYTPTTKTWQKIDAINQDIKDLEDFPSLAVREAGSLKQMFAKFKRSKSEDRVTLIKKETKILGEIEITPEERIKRIRDILDQAAKPQPKKEERPLDSLTSKFLKPATDLLDKLKHFSDLIKNYFTDTVAKLFFDTAVHKIWESISSVLQTIKAAIMTAPVTTILQFLDIFHESNPVKLGMRLYALSETFSVGNLVDDLASQILTLMTAKQSKDKGRAQRESGEFNSILAKLFGLTKMMNKPYVMSLLREFNIVMSGWKNLHELINNFIGYLPTWLTKLFTITDPRKRFGVESQSPGNPLYTMVQAYTELVSGENYASATAYEAFNVAWRASEKYIVSNYTPNEFVMRSHKMFLSNAKAMMHPKVKGAKPVPFVITLYGKPGTGKSSSWPVLLSGIIPGNINDVLAKSYTRNPKVENFDGYNPIEHEIFVYDDFGSMIDDDSACELMPIVSNADYLPPYASLEDPNIGVKGTSFDSKIVVLCTNFDNFSHCKQVADKVALSRRLGIRIHWNKQIDIKNIKEARYAVFRTNFEGKEVELLNAGGTNFYTVPELQILLRKEYESHFLNQQTVFEEFNSIMFKHSEKFDYRAVYETARPRKMAVKESSDRPILSSLASHLITSATFAAASYLSVNNQKLLFAVTALGAAWSVLSTLFKLFSNKDSDRESGYTTTARAVPKQAFTRVTREQGEDTDSSIIMKVSKNQLLLVNEHQQFVNGLVLTGTIIITMRHFIQQSKTVQIFTHRAIDPQLYEFDTNKVKIVHIKNTDLVLIDIGKAFNPFPSLLNYIPHTVPQKKGKGYVCRRSPDMIMSYEVDIEPGRVSLVYTDKGGYENTYSDISYRFVHKKGDCGNPLFKRHEGVLKIIGLHESGCTSDKEQSYAVALTQGEIIEYLKEFRETAIFSRSIEFPYEEVDLENGQGFNKMLHLGTSKTHVPMPRKTELRESLIFNHLQQHITEPAILRHTQEHDPLVKAFNKYSISTKQYPQKLVQHAVQGLTEELMGLVTDQDTNQIFTVEECLNGIPGFLEPANYQTSPGYPFVLTPETRRAKVHLLEGEPGTYKLGKLAQDHYDLWKTQISRNIIPSDPFIATLKDERRLIQKVRDCKTRLFFSGSLTSFLYNKQEFAAFCMFFQRIRSKSFSTLGFNRGSYEWHYMINRMKEVGSNGIDGDQSEWDGRFKSGVAMELLTLFDAYYGNERSNIRYILFCHAVFAYVRVTWDFTNIGKNESRLYNIPGCMPSGWYLTFVMNSLVNAVLMRMAWITLVIPPYNDLSYFRKYVREKYAGDDSLLTVAKDFIIYFNGITLQKFFKEYDQIYTLSDKGQPIECRDIEKCFFLKVTTRYEDGIYLPYFDREANLETTNWIRKCDNPDEQLESNCNDVLRNAYFYGEEDFMNIRNKILSLKPGYNLVSYQSLDSAFKEYGEIPDPFGTYANSQTHGVTPKTLLWGVTDKTQSEASKLFKTIINSTYFNLPTEEDGYVLIMDPNKLEDVMTMDLQDYDCAKILYNLKQSSLQPTDCSTPIAQREVGDKQTMYTTKFNFPLPTTYKHGKVSSLKQLAINTIFKKLLKRQNNIPYYTHDPLVSELFHWPPVRDFTDDYSIDYNNNDNYDMPSDWLYLSFLEMHDQEPTNISYIFAEREMGTIDQPVASNSTSDLQTRGAISNLDEANPQPTTRMGVHLSEQQETTIKKPVDGNVLVKLDRAAAHLNEDSWDLNKMLFRENFVSNITWSLTDAVGSALLFYSSTDIASVPFAFLRNQLVSVPFERFTYWRCTKAIIRFQLVASRFHQGRCLVSFLPTMSHNKATESMTFERATSLQHGFLDPSNGTVLDLEIPFRYYKGWLNLQQLESLGEVRVQVLNTLQAATGASTTVQIKVFISFVNSEFRVPRPAIDIAPFEAEREMGLITDMISKPLAKIEESILPQEVSTIIAGAIPLLLDKPAKTEYPPPLTVKDAQYMSSSRGVENLERMTLEPSAMYITDDQFGDTIDEMDLKYLLKKPIFFKTFNWAATQDVGTILTSGLNSPTHYLHGAPTPLDTAFTPTMLGYFSNLFTYWRGSIILKFQVVGTAFHEGRLDFCNHVALMTPPTTYTAAISQYLNSQTVRNTENVIEVRIPFHSDTPWKRIWMGPTLTEDPTSSTGQRALDYITGSYSLRVGVPLKNPNNVANNVDINMFVYAGDDFEFHTLSPLGGFLRPAEFTTTKLKRRAIREAGDLNDQDVNENQVVSLGVQPALTYDIEPHHFGESYHNLREMCKRYCTVQSRNLLLDEGNSVVSFDIEDSNFGGMLGWLARAYRLFRGPLNCKFQSFPSPDANALGYVGFVTTIPQVGSTGVTPVPVRSAANYMGFQVGHVSGPMQPPLVRFSHTQVAEFVMPFQSIFHSLKIFKDTAEDQSTPYYTNEFFRQHFVANVFHTGATTASMRMTLCNAFGDETRFGVWYGIPTCKITTVPYYPNMQFPPIP